MASDPVETSETEKAPRYKKRVNLFALALIAVLVVVLALYFLGGPVLRDFSLALILGVLVGTYSSVFVASPALMWMSRPPKARCGQEAGRTS